MKTKEIVQLNEGIKYFKDSRKIYSYIGKLEKKINSVQGIDADSKAKVEVYIEKLKGLAERLSEIEDKFSVATEQSEKFTLKNEYRKIKMQNMSLIKELNKEDFKKILIGSGTIFGVLAIISLLGGASSFIGGGDKQDSQPLLDKGGKIDNSNIGRVVDNVDAIKKELASRAQEADQKISQLQYQKNISDAQLKNIDSLIDKVKNVNKVGLFGWNNSLGFL